MTIEKTKSGTPNKLSKKDEEMLLRIFLKLETKLRNETKLFTARHIKTETSIKQINSQIFNRLLNRNHLSISKVPPL